MTLGPRTFSPFLAAIMVLWPIIAYMGAQGYTVAVALTALLGLVYVRVQGVRPYALAFMAFILWVVAANFWAPETQSLLSGNLFAGSFSMEMPGIRFGLMALAGLGTMVAVWAVAQGASRISLGVIVGMLIAQFVGLVITAMFMPQILALFAPLSDPVREMPQNLLRNATAFSMLMPFLLAWMWHRTGSDYWRLAVIGVGLAAFAAFAQTGSQTALVGTLIMLACMAIIKISPQNGFRITFTSAAFFIVAAPILMGWGIDIIRAYNVPLPESFFSRSYCWELVRLKIGESPFIGHGLEAAHSWRDTYAQHPEWLADAVARYNNDEVFKWENYPIIPIHPHNMPLQIWAETGMVGACLAAIFIFFLGWRLKAPQDWPPISRYGAAGLIGVCISISSFAYSMWNEAFWASVALAAAVILLQARHDGEAEA